MSLSTGTPRPAADYIPGQHVAHSRPNISNQASNDVLDALVWPGDGQANKAEDAIEGYVSEGGWVLLDNVHLAEYWLPTLEAKLEVLKARML